jgi:AcrR family transcriptional regulator
VVSAQDTNPDGRRKRSERSRQAIITSLLELIGEGILVPTAQQVSERAGVGIRSVFRHFSDMESLFGIADQINRENFQGLFAGGDRNGSLEERLQHAVEQHALAYESISNFFLSVKAQMWRFAILQEQYSMAQRQIRKDLDDWLPEIKALPASRREMVDAIASFETWHRLRNQQGQSREASTKILSETLCALILPD